MKNCTAQQAMYRETEYEDQKPVTYTKVRQVLCALRKTGTDPNTVELKDLVRQVEARRS